MGIANPLSWFLVWLLATPVCRAIDILASRGVLTSNADSSLLMNQEVTVRCRSTDMGIPRKFMITTAKNEVKEVTMRCGVPEYHYSMQRVGFIPRTGSIYTASVCTTRVPPELSSADQILVRAPIPVNGSLTGQPARRLLAQGDVDKPDDGILRPYARDCVPTEISNGGRKFCKAGLDGLRECKIWCSDLYLTVNCVQTRKCDETDIDQFWIDTGNAFKTMGDAIATWFSRTGDGCGPECSDIFKEMGKLTDALRSNAGELNGKRAQLEAEERLVENTTLRLLGAQTDINTNMLTLSTLLRDRITNATGVASQFQNNTDTYLKSAAGQIDDYFNRTGRVELDFNTLADEMALNLSEAHANDAAIQAAILSFARNVTVRLQQIIEDSRSQFAIGAKINEQNARGLSDGVGAIRYAIERRTQRRTLVRRIQEALDRVNYTSGFAFLRTLGSRGAYESEASMYLEVDQIGVYYLTGHGAEVRANRQSFVFMCHARSVLNATRPWTTWDAITDQIGQAGNPANTNCSTGEGNTTLTASCTCYIRYAVHSCNASERIGNYTTEQGGGSALVCNSDNATEAVTTDVDWRILRTPVEFMDAIAWRASQHIDLGTVVGEERAPVGVVSLYGGKRVEAHTAEEERKRINGTNVIALDKIMTRDILSGRVVVTQAMLVFLTTTFSVVWNSADTITDIMDGTMPSGVTFRQDPFTKIEGVDAECDIAGFVAYESDLIPVYRIEPVSTQTGIMVSIDGTVASTVQYAVVLSNPLSQILPGTEYLVGDVNGTEIYDVPQSDISLSPSPEGRRGKVTYPISPDAAGFNYAAWYARNGYLPFDAFEATNFASFYARPKVGQSCGGQARPYGGGWCNVLQSYSVFDNEDKSGLVLNPKTGSAGASYIASVVIPAGSISDLVFSECPLVTIGTEFAAGKTLHFTNPRTDTEVPISFHVRVEGCDDNSYLNILTGVAVPRQDTFRLFVPRCPSSASNIQITATITRTDPETGSTVACGTVDATTNRTHLLNETQIPDKEYVDTVTVVIQDTALEALAEIFLELNNAVSDAALTVLNQFVGTGLVMNASAFIDNFKIGAQRNQTIARIVDILGNSTAKRTNFAAYEDEARRRAQYFAEKAANTSAALDEQFAAAQDALDRQRTIFDDLEDMFANLSANRVYLNELKGAIENGTIQFAENTVKGMEAIHEANQMCHGFAGCLMGGELFSGLAKLITLGFDNSVGRAFDPLEEFGEYAAELGIEGLEEIGDGAKFLYKTLEEAAEHALNESRGFLERYLGSIGRTIKKIVEVIQIVLVIIGSLLLFTYCGSKYRPHPDDDGEDELVATSGRIGMTGRKKTRRRLSKKERRIRLEKEIVELGKILDAWAASINGGVVTF